MSIGADTAQAEAMNDKRRARRNVLLFWAHIALAALVLGWFVYSVAHK